MDTDGPPPEGNAPPNPYQPLHPALGAQRWSSGMCKLPEMGMEMATNYYQSFRMDRELKEGVSISDLNEHLWAAPDEEPEAASLDVPIASSNVGYKMMMRMGWKEGQCLGSTTHGIVEPIGIGRQTVGQIGLGKFKEYEGMTNPDNIRRPLMLTEAVLTPEEETRLKEKSELKRCIEADVEEIQKVFYCDLCKKPYKKVMEWEAHLSSYDHNHKKEMQALNRMSRSGGHAAAARAQQQQERELSSVMQRAAAAKASSKPVSQQEAQTQPLKLGGARVSLSLGSAKKKPRIATFLADDE